MQSSQNLHRTILCDPKTHLRGSLRATKCLDASYSVPRHHTITMGPSLGVPQAPWARQNQQHSEFHPFRGPHTQVKNPQNAEKVKKIEILQKRGCSIKISYHDHMANLLRLTRELGNSGFWIDGPEIWPSQKGGGGGEGGGGKPFLPPLTNNLDVNRGWYTKGIPSQ